MNRNGTALQLLNNLICFSKLTKSFTCFEWLPVPPKVRWQKGTLQQEWFEHSGRFHSLQAELNNTFMKFLKCILQRSTHFQLQNNMLRKHMWLRLLYYNVKKACCSSQGKSLLLRMQKNFIVSKHKIISEWSTPIFI